MAQKKIVSIEDRIPKFKEARKKKANRRLILYLCVFFLLIVLVVYVQSPLSHVRTIQVSGNTYLSDEEVEKFSGLNKKTNIWSVKEDKLAKKISKHPIIESATVERKLPSTVSIRIEEYGRIGYVLEKGKYKPLLGSGETLGAGKKMMNGDAPLLSGFTEKQYLKKMAQELQKLDPSICKLISEIYWKPTKDNRNKIELYMNDGFIVDGTIKDFAKKMEVYPSIVSQIKPGTKGVIHIGVGAYFEKMD